MSAKKVVKLFCYTFTFCCCGIPVGMGGAGCQTFPIVQSALRVHTSITVIAVWPVTQSTVRVATQTLPLLFVLIEPLRTF